MVAEVVQQGMVTMAGLLAILKENEGNVVFLNPEMEKLLCKQRQQYIQATDLIEVLDGSTTGRATSQDRSAPKPNAWAVLGAQLGTYVREMTGDSCARLRLLPTFLDDTAVAGTSFSEKLLPSQVSEDITCSVLRVILRLQHGGRELVPLLSFPVPSRVPSHVSGPTTIDGPAQASDEPPAVQPAAGGGPIQLRKRRRCGRRASCPWLPGLRTALRRSSPPSP